MKKNILSTMLSLLLLLVFATPVFAQGPSGAQVVFGNNLDVENETTLNRDVVVFGGQVFVDETSKINGDMAVFGGNVDIQGAIDGDTIVFGGYVTVDGTIDGDIGLVGGNISLGETAVVKGDIGLVGGQPDIAEGAVVEGEIRGPNQFEYEYGDQRSDDDGGFIPTPPAPPVAPDFPFGNGFSPFRWISNVVSDIFWNISLLVTLGLISWLVAAFMPEQMLNVRNTVTGAGPLSFGVGFLSSVVTAVSVLLVFTICLAFVPAAAALVIGVAALFGWIVIGQIIGERLLVASGVPYPNFIVSSIIGVAVLTLVTNMPVIGQIPCIGFLLSLVGSIVGLIVVFTGIGAVLLTRFGTRSYASGSGYSYGGGSGGGASPSPTGGSRVRWTDPAPDVSEEEPTSSEAELNAKIKAALAEADQAAKADAPADAKPEEEAPEDEETPEDETPPAEEKPKKRSARRKKPKDDTPDEDPKSDA